MQTYAIDTVLDVGANTGGFGLELRQTIGYRQRLVSFEPVSTAFEKLQRNASGDPQWKVLPCALGDTNESRQIHVSGNSTSSSMLDMLPLHVEKAPESRYTKDETIQVKTLDSLFESVCADAKNIYLKIDTQGFEGRVLKGAERSLPHIATVQIEMSLAPMYAGEMSFGDLYGWMHERRYGLVSVEPGFVDLETGQVLQVDGVFHRG